MAASVSETLKEVLKTLKIDEKILEIIWNNKDCIYKSKILSYEFFKRAIKNVGENRLLAELFFSMFDYPSSLEPFKIEEIVDLINIFSKWNIYGHIQSPLLKKIITTPKDEIYFIILDHLANNCFCGDISRVVENLEVLYNFCARYPKEAVKVLNIKFFKEAIKYLNHSVSWDYETEYCFYKITSILEILLNHGFEGWEFEDVEYVVKKLIMLKPYYEDVFEITKYDKDISGIIIKNWIKKLKNERINLNSLLLAETWKYKNIWLITRIIERHFNKTKLIGLNLKELLVILGTCLDRELGKKLVNLWFEDLKATNNVLVALSIITFYEDYYKVLTLLGKNYEKTNISEYYIKKSIKNLKENIDHKRFKLIKEMLDQIKNEDVKNILSSEFGIKESENTLKLTF